MHSPRLLLLVVLTTVSGFLWTLSTSATRAGEHDTVTTTLVPGLNYVGWLSPPATVAEFFETLPQVEAVFAWSATRQAWLAASPHFPESVQTLTKLRPGAGLVVRLGGDRAVEWTRPLTAGSRLLDVRPGFNLLAWAADAPASTREIEQNLRTSFERRGGAASPAEGLRVPDQANVIEPSGLVRQGGALWIHSELHGNWYQPSLSRALLRGVVSGPEGEPLEGVTVRADITDGSNWVWFDDTDAQGAFSLLVLEHAPYKLRLEDPFECQLYYRAGEAPARRRESATTIFASTTLASLQIQVPQDACGWHVRGRVVDARGTPLTDHAVWATETTTSINRWNRSDAQGAFDIRVVESGRYRLSVTLEGQCWAYYVGPGVTSAEHLAATLIEVDDAHINDFLFVVPDEPCGGTIRGTLTRSSGAPVAGASVTAQLVGGQYGFGAFTDADGSFIIDAFRLRVDVTYVLTVTPQDTCFVFYREDGVGRTEDDATQFSLSETRETRINIVLPEGVCEWRIYGRVLTSEGEPVTAVGIRAWGAGGERISTFGTASDSNGGFGLTVPESGSYRLVLELDDRCMILNEEGRWSRAHPITTAVDVAGGDLFGVIVETPPLRCGWRISGRVVDQTGAAIAGAPISLAPGDGGNVGPWQHGATEADGRFVIQTAAVDRTYLLRLDLGNGCLGYHSGDLLTPSWKAAKAVQISEVGVSGVLVRVPQDFCGR